MINTSWKTTACAVASGLLLAIGACSSGQEQQGEQEVLAVSQQGEALVDQMQEEFQQNNSNESDSLGLDAALAETLEAAGGAEPSGGGSEELPSVEDVLGGQEELANSEVSDIEPVSSALSGPMEGKNPPIVNRGYQEQPPMGAMGDGETFTYTVQKGDWLSKIAQHVYGDTNMWRKVAEENGLNNPDVIYPGQKITFAVTNSKSKSFRDSYARVNWYDNSRIKNGEDGLVDVVVERGDSLSKLAEKFFGNPMGWKKIYQSNQNQIANPDLIFVGQVLTISQSNAVAH